MVYVGTAVYAVTDLVFTSDHCGHVNGWIGFSMDFNSAVGTFGKHRNVLVFTLIKHRVH